MKRNCNLELRLVTTPSVFSQSSDHYNGRYHSSMFDDVEGGSPNEKQPLTIFYNGIVASSDATELQARTIIFLASKEMEEKSNNDSNSDSNTVLLHSPTTSLSMKRSLQRFLEKRKNRAAAQAIMSPYPNPIIRHHHHHHHHYHTQN